MSEFDYRDVLLKASELVAEEGRWTQNRWFVVNDHAITRGVAREWDAQAVEISVCVLGAVSLAGDRLGASERVIRSARSRLVAWIRKHLDYSGALEYNDWGGRTADEVAEVLRQAASV